MMQMFVYLAVFIIMAIIMGVVVFHVKRFRYNNDASIYVISTLLILFVLTGILTLTSFDYSTGNTTSSNVKNHLL